MAGKKTKYTVADLYGEASKLLKGEMSRLKNKPLSASEAHKMDALARELSKTVLREMKIV